MKGRLFRVSMLVLIAVLVLAVPASAGKPPATPTLTVGTWSYRTVSDSTGTYYYFTADRIAWKNVTTATWLEPVVYECAQNSTPASGQCGVWSVGNTSNPIAAGTTGKLRSLPFYQPVFPPSTGCTDFFPAVRVVDGSWNLLVETYDPAPVTICTP